VRKTDLRQKTFFGSSGKQVGSFELPLTPSCTKRGNWVMPLALRGGNYFLLL